MAYYGNLKNQLSQRNAITGLSQSGTAGNLKSELSQRKSILALNSGSYTAGNLKNELSHRKSLMGLVAAPPAGGSTFDYYLANSGNDTTGTGSEAAPWATYAKFVAAVGWADNRKLGFKYGDTFPEQINLLGVTATNILIGAWGTSALGLPSIEGSDIAGTWTLDSGNVWKQNWTHSASPAPSYIWVFNPDGTTVPYQNSIANCQANPGSFFTTNTTASGQTVYLQIVGGGNPNGLNYRITARRYGIALGLTVTGTVQDMHAARVGDKDGPITASKDSTIQRCIIEWGSIHNALVGQGCTFKNNVLHQAMNVSTTRALGSQNMLVVYDPALSGTVTGVTLTNNYIYTDNGELHYSHSGGCVFAFVSHTGMYGRGSTFGTCTQLKDFYIELPAAAPVNALTGMPSGLLQNGIIQGARTIMDTSAGCRVLNVAVKLHASQTPSSSYFIGNSYDIDNLSIYRASASFNNFFGIDASGITMHDSIVMNVANVIAHTVSPTYDADRNRYWRSAAGSMFWKYANVSYTNIGPWQAAAPGTVDDNSTQGDPAFVDPDNNNWAHSAGTGATPTVTVPNWTVLRAAWATKQLGFTPV